MPATRSCPGKSHPRRWWRRSSSSAGKKPTDRSDPCAALNLAAHILDAQRHAGHRLSLAGVLPVSLPGPQQPSARPTFRFDISWSLSGADLCTRASLWARRLRAARLVPGDPVALALSRGPDLAPLHVAALAGGHPVVPLNTSLASPELLAVLQAAQPKLVVATTPFSERHAHVRASLPVTWWDAESSAGGFAGEHAGLAREHGAFADAAGGFAGEHADLADEYGGLERTHGAFADAAGPRLDVVPAADDAPALLLFTSGTTGAPKSAPLSHGNLRANLVALASLWERTSQDRLLHILPAHHFHGLVLGIYGSLLTGNAVLMMPGFDAAATLAAIPALDVNLLMGVPTMYARLLEAGAATSDFSRVRLAISGSAPLPAALWTAFRERCGIGLVNRYGLTETGIVASTDPRAPRAGTVGKPLPGTDVRIRTEDQHDVSPGNADDAGVRGEICVRGPSVTAGYGNAPEANAQSFRNGFFHTGDLGHFDEHGDLHVEGRIKELIIVGGSNVVPGEVETPLSSVDGVAEVVVTGAAHKDLGEIVVAWIVAAAGVDTTTLEQNLHAQAERALSPYKRPRRYVFLDAIPRNAMGKVDRKQLMSVKA